MRETIKAGFARRIISPPKGIYLIGYGDRFWGNRGVHDHLTASTLAFDDGNYQVVIIACDLLAMNEFTLEKIIQDFNPGILLCCSHTHSGPIVYQDEKSSRKNKKFVNFLIQQISDSINDALSDLKPASLFWGKSSFTLAVNRREIKPEGKVEIGNNPEGFVDREVNIIQVRTQGGKPLANLLNMACHNVVLGPKNSLVSADWAGSMRRKIEMETGTPCLFIQGAAADLNPNHEWGQNDLDSVRKIGNTTAAEILSGFLKLDPVNSTPIQNIQKDIWLPLETKVNDVNPPATYRKILSKHTRIPPFLVDYVLNKLYPWKTKIEDINGYWSIPLKASLLKLGDIAWVGLGAEVFSEIGFRIKNHCLSDYRFFSSLTNGCIGYLPTSEDHALGGYEVDLAPYFYRLPGKIRADAEGIVLNEIQQMLDVST